MPSQLKTELQRFERGLIRFGEVGGGVALAYYLITLGASIFTNFVGYNYDTAIIVALGAPALYLLSYYMRADVETATITIPTWLVILCIIVAIGASLGAFANARFHPTNNTQELIRWWLMQVGWILTINLCGVAVAVAFVFTVVQELRERIDDHTGFFERDRL